MTAERAAVTEASAVSRDTRIDAIAGVEACYALERSAEASLDQLARLARASLGGLAAFAVAFELRAGVLRPVRVGAAGGGEEFGRALFEAVHCGAPDVPARQLRQARVSPVASLSELLGERLPAALAEIACEAFPVRDALSVCAWGAGIWAVAAHERRVAPTTAQQRAWTRLVPHVEAGAHLRAALGDGEHAASPERCARERLREAALSLHRARGERAREERGLDLWAGLVAGRFSLVDRFVADGRRLVVAIKSPPSVLDPRALTERERQIVELAAEGASNKNIAYTLGVGESGVGTQLGRALRKLGLERRTELAPAMRAVAVEARIGAVELAVAGVDLWVNDVALSSAERAVVQALLRGHSDREIAIERGTSERTVANQLRSIFRKLGVASRAELIARASLTCE